MKAAPHHILAIDPAERMGLARWQQSTGTTWSGLLQLEGKTRVHKVASAFEAIAAKIKFFHDAGAPITAVYCEAGWARPGRSGAAAEIFKLEGAIELACVREDVPLTIVPAESWRKNFLGKGLAKGKREELKQRALEQARGMGFTPKSHDEADALGILWHARMIVDPAGLYRRAT